MAAAPARHRPPPVVAQALAAPGRPMEPAARARVERRFGQDFSAVRIHDGALAAASARAIGARAYVLGPHVVLGPGAQAAERPAGEALLAHEMAHVVQQRAAAPAAAPEVGPPSSRQEAEAARPGAALTPVPRQLIQRAPEEGAAPAPAEEFSLGGPAVDVIGRSAFGARVWPFVRAMLEGAIGGLIAGDKAGRAQEAKDHLKGLMRPWNAARFAAGYAVGAVIGLVSPVTDLVKGLVGLVKLSASACEWMLKWSAAGVAASVERQQKLRKLLGRLGDLGEEFGKSLVAFAKDPVGTVSKLAGLVDQMMEASVAKAREIGARAAGAFYDFLKREFYELGRGVGEVVGMLVAQVLLLVFSQAIGNLLSKGGALLGKAAEFAAGKAAEVIAWARGAATWAVGAVRALVGGPLRMFEGLLGKAARVFEDLTALFSEAASALAAESRAAAGVGRGGGAEAATSGFAESRMVEKGRTTATTVAELKTPPVHPANVGKPPVPEAPPQPPKRTRVAQPETAADDLLREAEQELSPERFAQYRKTMERGEGILEEFESHGLPEARRADLLGREAELVRRSAEAGAARAPLHHVLSQNKRQAAWFAERGFEGEHSIHHYTIKTRGAWEHEVLHYGQRGGKEAASRAGLGPRTRFDWNSRIGDMIKRLEAAEKRLGRKMAREEVLAEVRKIMKDFGIERRVPHQYGSGKPSGRTW